MSNAAPVVAAALGTAAVWQVGGSVESSSEQVLPAPVLALVNAYVKSCCAIAALPLLTRSKVSIWKSPGSMFEAISTTPDALGVLATSSRTVLNVPAGVDADEVK